MGGNLFLEDLIGSYSVTRWGWHPWIGACLAPSRCYLVCHGGKRISRLSRWTACVMVLLCSMRLVSLALCFITLECLSGRALECGEMLTDPGNTCCSWHRWNPPPAHPWSYCLELHLIIPSVKWGDYSVYRIDGWDDVWEVMHDVWEMIYMRWCMRAPPGPPWSLISSPCILHTQRVWCKLVLGGEGNEDLIES